MLIQIICQIYKLFSFRLIIIPKIFITRQAPIFSRIHIIKIIFILDIWEKILHLQLNALNKIKKNIFNLRLIFYRFLSILFSSKFISTRLLNQSYLFFFCLRYLYDFLYFHTY